MVIVVLMLFLKVGRKIGFSLWSMYWMALGLSLASPEAYLSKTPKTLDDLRDLQKSFQENLAKTRAATVCLEIGDGSGSGVIISPDGLILTAAHVSTDVDVEISVLMEDGKKLKAKSLGLNSKTDSAMIQLLEEGPFPYVEYDVSDSFELGDWVFSLGHSGGFDETRGVVARLGRLVKLSETTIQSGCVLIGGDSGGPLFDINGTLIAINSRVGDLKRDSRHVPMGEFYRFWDRLKSGEFIGEGPFAKKRIPGSGFIGIKAKFDEQGLWIEEVAKKSPAYAAGLSSGVQILEVNGEKVQDLDLLEIAMKKLKPGEKIRLKCKKGDQSTEVELRIAEGVKPS